VQNDIACSSFEEARYFVSVSSDLSVLEKYSRNNMQLNPRQPPSDIQGSHIRSQPREPKPSFIQISWKVSAYHQFQSNGGARTTGEGQFASLCVRYFIERSPFRPDFI